MGGVEYKSALEQIIGSLVGVVRGGFYACVAWDCGSMVWFEEDALDRMGMKT